MFRFLTAGESHGPALIALLEGIPAAVQVTTADISADLRRRRLGVGRGARMKFEADEVRIISGVRHGETIGSPIAIEVANTEWPKWQQVMAADPVPDEELAALARNAPLSRPRPGHADLAGMQKYDHDDAREILERASARETAARVAAGTVARNFLAQALGVTIFSHVVGIGGVMSSGKRPTYADLPQIDADPVRCFDSVASGEMVAEITSCQKDGDTLGGVIEVVAEGVPPGLGSHIQADLRLDARLAGAMMGIQAIKGVEIGAGFDLAARRGSQAHDEMLLADSRIQRASNRAGGIEGGMSTGEPLVIRAAMKPIATVPRALRTIDTATQSAATAHHQRSDVCAVPAAGIVAEAMCALVLGELALAKFGGDSLGETRRNAEMYLARLTERGLRTW